MTSANAEFFMYLLWCNEDRADNDDILWLIKNERNYEASEYKMHDEYKIDLEMLSKDVN